MDIIKEYDYDSLISCNFVRKISPGLKSGAFHIDPVDGKVILDAKADWNHPWVHVKMFPNSKCYLWMGILFEYFNGLSTRCMNCWKVVVRPQTVKQLIELYEIQKTMNVPCKCGIEKRKYVPALYGGYFYCTSVEEGQKRYKDVKSRIDKEIQPDEFGRMPTIILKRGCTEYETDPVKGKGPSDKWIQTDDDRVWESFILEKFKFPKKSDQLDMIVLNVVQGWLEYAWSNGDMTCKEFNKGQPYWPEVLTYNEED